MSICLAELTTRSEITAREGLLLPLILALGALLIAWLFGAFKRDRVVGPARTAERATTAGQLWLIAFIGFLIWQLVPALLVLTIMRPSMPKHSATTHAATTLAATTAPAELTSMQLVTLAALSPAIGFAALVAMDRLISRHRSNLIHRSLGYPPGLLGRGIAIGLLGSLVAIPLTIGASNFTVYLVELFRFPQPRDHTLLQIFEDPNATQLKWIIVVSATLIAPLFEELFFRGHVQTALAATVQPLISGANNPLAPFAPLAEARWISIVVTAALFAVVHESGWMMPPLIVLATCIGYVYERTGNLWAAITMHAAFNAFSITMVQLGR